MRQVLVPLFALLLMVLPASATQITRVTLDKSDRELTLWAGDQAFKSYKVALGFAPEGHKRQQGDGRTPEGRYVIDYRNPQSKYHLSLHISYPNAEDKADAAQRGVDPGGDIFIHGQTKYSGWIGLALPYDWTQGCIAVTNAEIEEIWELVPNGTPIIIFP